MKAYFFLTLFLIAGCAHSQKRGQSGGRTSAPPQDTTKRSRPAPEADCGLDLEYDENTDIISHKKSLQPYTGVCRTYYEDNRLEREVHFVDGKEDGRSVVHYQRFKVDENGRKTKDNSPSDEPGQIQVITEYKMGVPNGTWQYYFENGQLAWVNYYLDGKKTDVWIYYYEDGKVKKEESWKDDKKNGPFKEYFKNGNLKSEINYKDDYLDGTYIIYYEDGKEFQNKKYKMGKEDGEVLTYHKNGQTASIQKFINGKPEGTWYGYFDDGKERSIEIYVKGLKEGEHKEFHKEGGLLKKRTVYKLGKVVLMEEFDEFGNKIEKGVKKEDD